MAAKEKLPEYKRIIAVDVPRSLFFQECERLTEPER